MDEEKKNMDLGLLKLVQKNKKGELELKKEKGLINSLSNLSKKIQKRTLDEKLSPYLKEVLPVTTYYYLDSLSVNEIKDRLSDIYYEAMQIPNEIIEGTLKKMNKVDVFEGRYYIHPGYKRNYEYSKSNPDFA
jgi:hypothetical protein